MDEGAHAAIRKMLHEGVALVRPRHKEMPHVRLLIAD
jgi:hypothetical protein